ncbi:MAG: hypothetical protein QOG84_1780 [Sphingomonadales bacterium]|nr:hypothetical protein [Sphingomonadales bacterium]
MVERLKYISIFYVPRVIEEFSAGLTLTAEGEIVGLGDTRGKFDRTFIRPNDLEEDEEEWMVLSDLSLRDLTFSNKSRLRAVLRLGEQRVESSLQIRSTGPFGQTSDNSSDAEDATGATQATSGN